jgi:hypothetical protein
MNTTIDSVKMELKKPGYNLMCPLLLIVGQIEQPVVGDELRVGLIHSLWCSCYYL